MNHLLAAVFAFVLIASPAIASPIAATLDGCVTLNDPRLAGALWFAPGTFQAVAFDDPLPGCEPTIATQIADAFTFDEDRVGDTLAARLNLSNLPTCGRRQYDLHMYLSGGVLDPLGLKSLVIDTGIACSSGAGSGGSEAGTGGSEGGSGSGGSGVGPGGSEVPPGGSGIGPGGSGAPPGGSEVPSGGMAPQPLLPPGGIEVPPGGMTFEPPPPPGASELPPGGMPFEPGLPPGGSEVPPGGMSPPPMVPVPEPGTFLLVAAGGFALRTLRRRTAVRAALVSRT